MSLMSEDEMFELAKRVHPPKNFSPTALKVICMDHSVKNWKFWLDIFKRHKINIFEKLSPLLRNDLIDRLTTSYYPFHWPQREFLLLLLNAQTKSLNLEECQIAFRIRRECLPFFKQVVAKAPNLVSLSFNDKAKSDKILFRNTTKAYILNTIVKLEKLEDLCLYGYFSLTSEDLMLVTKSLKNLICLKVQLPLSVKLDGFEYMRDLKKLEEFHFAIFICMGKRICRRLEEEEKVTQLVYSWCAQNLPQLKLIGRPIGPDNIFEKGLPLRLTPKFSGTSCLETLHTRRYLPEANMPNLKHLRFCGPNDEQHFLKKICNFRNLTTLFVQEISANDLNQFLEHVGNQLSNLSVKNLDVVEADFYYKIFHLCPNLVELQLSIDTFSNPPVFKYKELVSGKNLLRLENVELKCGTQDCLNLPDGILRLIFEAPLIEYISLDFFSLRKEDCDWLQDVEEGRFRKLRSLTGMFLMLDPGCTRDDFALMIKRLICGAPNLRYMFINFYGTDDDEPSDWCQGHHDVRKFLKLLDEMSFLRR